MELNLKGAPPFSLPERMIATRYLRAKKSEGGVALIAAISFACIMLAVASMIIIMSIMTGFREQLIDLTVGAEGHVFVERPDGEACGPTPNATELALLQLDDVVDAYCYTQDLAGVQANGRISVAQVNGIRPRDLQEFEAIRDGLLQGTLSTFGQGSAEQNQIVIGRFMADQLGVGPGDKIVIYSGRTRSTIAGQVPINKAYTVGGIFQTGAYAFDLSNLYLSLDQASLLFNDGAPVSDIQVRLTDADLIDDIAPDIRETVGGLSFLTDWRNKNASLAQALRTEQIVMRLIFMIVVIIATFPVLAAMIMLVKNKSRDIAILRTIGATRGAVLRIFFITGAMIGILGTIVGLVLGVLFCLNIGAVQTVIEAFTGQELFPASAYQLSDGKIPAKLVWDEIAIVAGWGMVISFLATLLPAWQASRTDPVEALRYE